MFSPFYVFCVLYMRITCAQGCIWYQGGVLRLRVPGWVRTLLKHTAYLLAEICLICPLKLMLTRAKPRLLAQSSRKLLALSRYIGVKRSCDTTLNRLTSSRHSCFLCYCFAAANHCTNRNQSLKIWKLFYYYCNDNGILTCLYNSQSAIYCIATALWYTKGLSWSQYDKNLMCDVLVMMDLFL